MAVAESFNIDASNLLANNLQAKVETLKITSLPKGQNTCSDAIHWKYLTIKLGKFNWQLNPQKKLCFE